MSKPHSLNVSAVVGRDLREQRRVAVGHEQAEALLEMMHLRALWRGPRRACPCAPRWQPVNA